MVITGSSRTLKQDKKGRFWQPTSRVQRPREPGGWISLGWRSIYVLPTATGLAFVLSLLVMLLLAINYQNSLAYALCFLLGSVFILSVIPAWRALYQLRIRAMDSPAVFAGQQAQCHLRLEPFFADGAVRFGYSIAALKPPSFLAEAVGCFQQTLQTTQRGWCYGGVIRVESRVPFGLWVAWSWVDPEWRVLVYPKPIPAQFIKNPTSSDQGSPQTQSGMGDYNGVRTWQSGESMRRLDWKAFSREKGLLVKDFVALSSTDTDLLDFDAFSGDTEQRLSHLCHELLLRAPTLKPFSVHVPGKRLGPDCGAAYVQSCLQALALYGVKESP